MAYISNIFAQTLVVVDLSTFRLFRRWIFYVFVVFHNIIHSNEVKHSAKYLKELEISLPLHELVY